MLRIRVGAASVTRIEETYAPVFAASTFFPAWDPSVLERHSGWMVPDHYDPATGFLKLSVHSWLIEVGGRRILIDTCVGRQLRGFARAGFAAHDDHLVRCDGGGDFVAFGGDRQGFGEFNG